MHSRSAFIVTTPPTDPYPIIPVLTCDVSFCDDRANIIRNDVKLCREHHDNPEWQV